MEELKEKIKKEGKAINDKILKVDSFINHQVDSELMDEIGKEFARYFKEKEVTKVITIESGGIAPGIFTARHLGVPLVILKKQTSKILDQEVYQTKVKSFTKGNEYELTMSKKYLNENDNVLIIDDFLAQGEAALGLIRISRMASANIVGIGILIEKSFQEGRERLEKEGYPIYSLARVSKLAQGKIEFMP